MFWRFHGPVTPQTIALVTFLDGAPDLDRLRELFARTIFAYPRMRSVVRPNVRPGEPPALVPFPEIDLRQHVEALALPETAGRAELEAELARRFSTPLPLDRPLWHLLLVSLPGPEAPAAILWRIHHLVADGVTALAFAHEILGGADKRRGATDERSGSPPPAVEPASRPRPRLLTLLRSLRAWGRLDRGPSPLNGESSPERRLTPVDLDRATLRRLMRRFDASSLEVLLNVLTSALRRYHEHHGAPVDRDLTVVIPYADQPPSRARSQGNFFGSRFVRLPLGEPDPSLRFDALRRTVRAAGEDGVDELLRFVSGKFHRLPRGFQRDHLWDFALRCNAACTVLPSRLGKARLDGHAIAAHYAGAALPFSHGAAFTFLATESALRGMIVSDPAIVPDPERLRDFLLAGVEELVTRRAREA